MMSYIFKAQVLCIFTLLIGCAPSETSNTENSPNKSEGTIHIDATSYKDSDTDLKALGGNESISIPEGEHWFSYDVTVEQAGRYKVEAHTSHSSEDASLWIEDYIENKDGRTYNITGTIALHSEKAEQISKHSVDGSPLNEGLHKIKVHTVGSGFQLKSIMLSLMVPHQKTPSVLSQKTDGKEWKVVWADEFNGSGQPDASKWTFDVGDWGWGNNELQYYTDNRVENARQENGNLIIEARKNDMNHKWTSARLTTRGKTSFLYGKIEFRAKVPREKGNWAAGWTLGDEYVDELSWPYCGEIDILESVGYEVDNESGDGIAHATVHTPAYYFKINNQISSEKQVKGIASDFHTYAVEWTPTEVRAYVDGEHYYTYDKNANEKEWPFNKAQNIILNLAMGGGWGGAKGMDESVTSQQFLLDYVRVYEKP